MIELRPEDLLHKSYLNRLLIEISDHPILAHALAFKGGTCAGMLGYLDRFSVDLDFDVTPKADSEQIRLSLRKIYNHLGLLVIKEFDNIPFYQIRYQSPPGKRNSIKVSVNTLVIHANQYKVQYFPEIDRYLMSQTIETMVANKLVAVTDRFRQHQTVAGRDIYDIHFFLTHGYNYLGAVIEERTGQTPLVYFSSLIDFIQKHVTQTIINEDLNTLLPPKSFQQIRKILIPETLSLLARERAKLSAT
jgi:predicted nucleotidyltransferase component of viral defense system